MFKYGEDYLTAGKALQIARGQLKGVLSDSNIDNINKSAAIVQEIVAKNASVYGINTGFGPLCNTRISSRDTAALQHKLLISHSVGVGEPIALELAKLMMILKVHALAKGFSGVTLDVINRIIWHIDQDVIPLVPEQGSVGASGDLAPLSHLFIPLIGEGELFYQDKFQPTIDVLNTHGLKPITLSAKEGLGLINGTQFIAAHAVQLVEQLHQCLSQADINAALMIEGLMGSTAPFNAVLHELRAYQGNIHVARRVHALMKGSEILLSHIDCDKVQDPYSMRCVPQVHGASRNAWLHLKESVEIEINSVTDNPVIISEDLTISGGNFHGQPLALPIDYACLAASELGNISDRRAYLSLEGKYDGTPKLLLKETGMNSGFMIVQYTGAALASENKGLCFPSSADSIPTSLGQEDHVSMGSIGSRKALQVCKNLKQILAIELLCAAQAFDFRRPLRSSEILEQVHAAVRGEVTHATEDRLFGKDIKKIHDLIASNALVDICNNAAVIQKNPLHDLFENY